MMTSSNGNIFRVIDPLCGISQLPVNSPHKGQWRGALMFPLICAWANNHVAGDLRRHRVHYDATVMITVYCTTDYLFKILCSISGGGVGVGADEFLVHYFVWVILYAVDWPLASCMALLWRHKGRDAVSNHQPHDCLLNRLIRSRSKKTSKLRVTGLRVGNSPVTGEFPAQMASNAESVSIWWRHHISLIFGNLI